MRCLVIGRFLMTGPPLEIFLSVLRQSSLLLSSNVLKFRNYDFESTFVKNRKIVII